MAQPDSGGGSVVFDRAADYYDETRGFPPGEEGAVAALIARVGGLTRSARVVEVGIGTGRIALPLSAHVGMVLGVDLSRLMLDRLRAKRRGEPVRVVLGDVTRLPVASASCDAAVAVHIFHLVPDWQGALREVARILKPGGVLLAGRNDMDRSMGSEGVLWQAWDAAVGSAHEVNVGVPRERYATFLEDEGWQPLGEPGAHTYTIRRQVKQTVGDIERGVWSSHWRLSEEQRAAGIAAVRAALVEHAFDPDQWNETQRRFVVRAYAPPGGRG